MTTAAEVRGSIVTSLQAPSQSICSDLPSLPWVRDRLRSLLRSYRRLTHHRPRRCTHRVQSGLRSSSPLSFAGRARSWSGCPRVDSWRSCQSHWETAPSASSSFQKPTIEVPLWKRCHQMRQCFWWCPSISIRTRLKHALHLQLA